MPYQHILVPIDDSPIAYAAMEHAQDIAQAFDAQITLVSVVAIDPFVGVDFYKVAPSITDHIFEAEKNAEGRLQDLKQTLEQRGFAGCARHFIECVQNQTVPQTAGEQALLAQRVVEKLWREAMAE